MWEEIMALRLFPEKHLTPYCGQCEDHYGRREINERLRHEVSYLHLCFCKCKLIWLIASCTLSFRGNDCVWRHHIAFRLPENHELVGPENRYSITGR